jgi:uncharacterized protein (TIGR04255 family)
MDSSHKPNLINFDEPPVVETVLSAQFEKLEGFRSIHFGLFWERVRSQFPQSQEQGALEPSFEEFGTQPPPVPRIQFLQSGGAALPQRVLLTDSANSEMMQIQSDRFIKNWRKTGEDDTYPRYEPVIREAFHRDFEIFKKFLADEGIGSVRVTQCEVTYVNHILSGKGWSDWSEADKVFTFWNPPRDPHYPGKMEDFAMHTRFPIYGDHQEKIGRLHVDVQPALRSSDGLPMYVMNLTARGQYGEGTDFFDIGRRYIVHSFKSLTTDQMHRIWREK